MKKKLCHLALLIILTACGSSNDDSSQGNIPQAEQEVEAEILTEQSDVIWGFDFLSNQQIIFTERSGNVKILNSSDGTITNVTGAPDVAAGGEGGLLDLKLHPDFVSNNLVYFCYTDGSPGSRSQSLGRAELSGSQLINFQRLFNSGSPNGASNHFGCRILFQNDSSLFLSLGEQGEPSRSQDAASFHGKILRMSDDGTNVQIWSSGHRNPQGLAFNPQNGNLFSVEHGPSGGDELNVITQNANYGWPRVTRGSPQGDLGPSSPGFVDPIQFWTPAIAPSGITFYTGSGVPQWRNNLFIAALRGRHIRRLVIQDNAVVEEEQLFESLNTRFRNVKQGPDGFLYFSTDDGKIGRVVLIE